MKVIQVAHWPRSGLTAVMRDIGRTLQAKVQFQFVEMSASETTNYYGDLGPHIALDFRRKPLGALRRFSELLRSTDADLVHVHSLQPLLWTGLLGGRRLPVVSTVHNEYPFLTGTSIRDRIKRTLQRAALARTCPVVVAVSRRVTKLLTEALLAGERIETIENAISPLPAESLPHIRRQKRGQLGIAGNEFLVVSAGRLHDQKGFDLLIRAFAAVKIEHPGARLIIAGEGPERQPLQQLILRAGLGSTAFLAGHVSPLLEFLAAADLFVMSSRYEGCPLALAEAMSCGIPTISTPVGTAPDLLGDCCPELLTDRVDSDSLARAMLTALAPSYDRIGVGRRLDAIVRRSYTLERFGERYLAVYESAMREGRP